MMEPEYIRRAEDYFETARGSSLFFRSWQPPLPERVIILVHGFGEHSGRYEKFASWFSRRGFAVYAHDQQGHGHSPGKRGHVDQFDYFLDDVQRLIAVAAIDHPHLPRVLIGHSMGGLIVTSLACTRRPAVNFVVASSPALSLSPDISPVKLRMARLLRRIVPRLSMSAGLDATGLSSDANVVQDYLADPLVHGQVTVAMGAGMSDTILRTEGAAGNVGVPMLLLHGESDPLCRVEGSRAFYAGMLQGEQTGSAIRTYPDMLHEIFNEPDREKVYADLLEWILRVESL
jgi:alpha-beta hydrolase superfamily lysophospholipase